MNFKIKVLPLILFILPLLSSLQYGTAWTAALRPTMMSHLPSTTQHFPKTINKMRIGSRSQRFSPLSNILSKQKLNTQNPAHAIRGGAAAAAAADSSSNQIIKRAPPFVYTLNASTKWLITIAQSIGVWSRTHSFEGPFIVVGSIAATFLTELLKRWINQGRPDGAPFSDPGMPSSHSLVCFFAAMGWMGSTVGVMQSGYIGRLALLGSAMMVAILRVLCGYHSLAQILVGAVIGVVLGKGWSVLGKVLHMSYPEVTFVVAWVAYLLGSALYISKRMKGWVTHEKAL